MVFRGVFVGLIAAVWLAGSASAAPTVVGSIANSVSLSGATAVNVQGNLAYQVSYWSGQLNVIDISNPASPQILGSTTSATSMTAATNIAVAGGFAFVTSKNRNGPCNPGPIPSCNNGSNDDGSGNSLTIVDVSNPASPSVVGTVTDPNFLFGAEGVAVQGNFAYVAAQGELIGQPQLPDTSTGAFVVIDITSKAGPKIVAHILNTPFPQTPNTNWLEHSTSVAVSGNFAYVTGFYDDRVTAIDISNPLNPILKSTLRDPTNLVNPNDVAIQGNFMYVAGQNNATTPQFTVVNIANPLNMSVVASITNSSMAGAYRVKTLGNFAYVASNAGVSPGPGVTAINVSDPTHPSVAGSVQDPTTLPNPSALDVSTNGFVVAVSPHITGQSPPTYPVYPLQTGGPTDTGMVGIVQLDSSTFGTTTTTTTTTTTSAPPSTPITTTTTTSTPAPNLAPRNTSHPTIGGMVQQGVRLSAGTGSWSGAPASTYTYQWERCNAMGTNCRPITGQTGATYAVSFGDVGSRLLLVVTATNSSGSASSTSAPTSVVNWPSHSFSSVSLMGAKARKPSLSLSVPSLGFGLRVQQLEVSLPHGLTFQAPNKAQRKAGWSLKHGVLTITFKKPPAGTLQKFGLSLSGALRKQLGSHHAKPISVQLTLRYLGLLPWHGTVTIRVS